MLLATEVTKLTRRQQWTVFRVQRPNLSTVSTRPICCGVNSLVLRLRSDTHLLGVIRKKVLALRLT